MPFWAPRNSILWSMDWAQMESLRHWKRGLAAKGNIRRWLWVGLPVKRLPGDAARFSEGYVFNSALLQPIAWVCVMSLSNSATRNSKVSLSHYAAKHELPMMSVRVFRSAECSGVRPNLFDKVSARSHSPVNFWMALSGQSKQAKQGSHKVRTLTVFQACFRKLSNQEAWLASLRQTINFRYLSEGNSSRSFYSRVCPLKIKWTKKLSTLILLKMAEPSEAKSAKRSFASEYL